MHHNLLSKGGQLLLSSTDDVDRIECRGYFVQFENTVCLRVLLTRILLDIVYTIRGDMTVMILQGGTESILLYPIV